jgi:CO/xanthine dehydrogenase FAD-binding subunit
MLADIAVHRPATLEEALAVLADAPDDARPTPLAGGTDLMVVLNSRQVVPSSVLDLWRVDELRGIAARDDGSLWIGALTTYRSIIASPLANERSPALVEASRTVGALQIQSRGTLGGNVANASPAGDTLPVLLAQGCDVVLQSRDAGRRTVAFDGFYAGYRQPDIRSGELIVGFVLHALPEGATSWYRKVGTRLAQAISKVVLAGVASKASDGTLNCLRIAAGSVAPTPIRLHGAEATGRGGLPGDVAAAVGTAARADVVPIDDVRSNADYRREVTGRVVEAWIRSL